MSDHALEMARLQARVEALEAELATAKGYPRESPWPLDVLDQQMAVFKAVLQRAPYGVVIKDAALRFRLINPLYCELLGLPQDDLVGKSAAEIFPPELARGFDEEDRLVLDTLQPLTRTFPLFISGRHRWLRVHKSPIVDSVGNVYGVLAAVIDITERQTYKLALEESQRRYHQLFEASNVIKMLIDPVDGAIIDVNQAACTFHGYNRFTFLTLNFGVLCPSMVEEALLARLADDSAPGAQPIETVLVDSAGRPRQVEMHHGHINFGVKDYVYLIIHDIEARKQAEADLRRSEERLELAMRGANLILWDCDLKRDEIFSDARIQDVLGYDQAEIRREAAFFRGLVHPGDTPMVMAAIAEHLSGQAETLSFECRVRAKDQSHRWFLLTGKIVGRDEAGQPARMTGTVMDITRRKTAELEHQRLIRELTKALAEVRTLTGLLPICSHCKKIRDDQGYWNQLEAYLIEHSNAEFTHSICPECAKELYPEIFQKRRDK